MSSSTADVELLLQPVRIGAWDLRNRIIAASLTRNRGVVPSQVNADYYALRAPHAGLIIAEGTLIEPQGTEWPYAPGLFTAEQVRGWQLVTQAVHKRGGLILAQLWHVGRVAHPLHQAGQPAVAPSAVAAKGGKFRLLQGVPGYQLPRAIESPEHFVSLFRKAAEAAKEAGFDGVELQGAGGYLCHEFLDPVSNQRTDEWGGSVENRCRFTLRVIDELIDVWGADRVAIKVQPAGGFNDMTGGGQRADVLATYRHLLSELGRRRIAFVELEQYGAFLDELGVGLKDLDSSTELGPAFQGPIVANTGFDLRSGAAAVREGRAVAVSFGRAFLSNPDLPERWKHGLPLNDIDWQHVYGGDGVAVEKGYNDYPLVGQ